MITMRDVFCSYLSVSLDQANLSRFPPFLLLLSLNMQHNKRYQFESLFTYRK